MIHPAIINLAKHNDNQTQQPPPKRSPERGSSIIGISNKLAFVICLTTLLAASTILIEPAEAMWLFQSQKLQQLVQSTNQTSAKQLPIITSQQQQELNNELEAKLQDSSSSKSTIAKQAQSTGSMAISASDSGEVNSGSYGSGLLSIAGIQAAGISSILNTVGDTGFRYFNIQDQCRNRAACDLGAMLYKKLSFIHNWLIRTSVRSLTDMNNIYMQSWMEGMLGRNCTSIYSSCRQSPLEGLMNLAMLQHLVY